MTIGARWMRGFTLVEVLIALSLLSLLMLVLTGAMRSLGQTEERIEQRVVATDDYRTVANFLRDVVGRPSARRHPQTVAGAPPEVPFFEARADWLAWVGVMPARFGTGGRHFMRLAVETAGGESRLVLRYAPWNGESVFNAWQQASAQVLAAPVSAIALRYQDPSSGRWGPVWPPAGATSGDLPPTMLPAAVEVQVAGAGPAWPPFIVALVPTRISDPSATGAAFGGSSR